MPITKPIAVTVTLVATTWLVALSGSGPRPLVTGRTGNGSSAQTNTGARRKHTPRGTPGAPLLDPLLNSNRAEQAQVEPSTRSSVAASSVALPQNRRATPMAPAPNAQPNPPAPPETKDNVPYLNEDEAEELKLSHAVRDLALARVRTHMRKKPLDDERTGIVLDEFTTQYDGMGLTNRPKVRCTRSICEVTVDLANTLELEKLEQANRELGYNPLTTTKGDPSQAIVNQVTYHLVDEDELTNMVGADPESALAPGPTQSETTESDNSQSGPDTAEIADSEDI